MVPVYENEKRGYSFFSFQIIIICPIHLALIYLLLNVTNTKEMEC